MIRTHADIVRAHGASNLYRDLTAKGHDISASTPQRWVERNSIPSEYWATLVELELTTLEELASGADSRTQAAA